MGTVLKTEAITMRFGGVTAVNELKLNIEEHKIVALIGPNGAGKTTAFNMITGVYTPTEGKVKYTCPGKDEVDITGKRPSDIAKMGIARTFQNIRLFKDLSVYENVMINLKGTNEKLKGRQCRIVSDICNVDIIMAEKLLNENERNIKKAIKAYKGE